MKRIYWFLIFIPITLLAQFVFHLSDGLVFVFCCLGIVPLAAVLGDATEQISYYTGPKVGGFLNATMGNVPELLIAGFAVKAGLHSLVLASLAGSILGNILLVTGMSLLFGGLKFKSLSFNVNITHVNFSLLAFGLFCVVIPFLFRHLDPSPAATATLENYSVVIAIIMVAVYALGVVFSLITHREIFLSDKKEDDEADDPEWSLKKGVIIMAAAAVCVAVMSEILVDTVEVAAIQFGLSEAFIGIILIPILGNVAEHAAAVIMAYKGKLDISIEIAVGSSMQIMLFVTPLMIVLSAIVGNIMEYVYTPMEVLGIVSSVVIAIVLFANKKVTWLEGMILTFCYVSLGAAFLMFGL